MEAVSLQNSFQPTAPCHFMSPSDLIFAEQAPVLPCFDAPCTSVFPMASLHADATCWHASDAVALSHVKHSVDVGLGKGVWGGACWEGLDQHRPAQPPAALLRWRPITSRLESKYCARGAPSSYLRTPASLLPPPQSRRMLASGLSAGSRLLARQRGAVQLCFRARPAVAASQAFAASYSAKVRAPPGEFRALGHAPIGQAANPHY